MKWQLVLLDHGLYCEMSPHLRQQYADFWVAATLGDGDSTVQICKKWGVADEDAAELFASLTLFRRVQLGAGRFGSVTRLFSQSGHAQSAHPAEKRRKMTPEERAAAEAKIKARAKKVLGDTKAFPQELFFVGRNLNIIRSANFSLGSAVNRVAILAECAAVGSMRPGGSLAAKDELSRHVALLKFHARVQSLLVADRLLRTLQLAAGLLTWSRGCLGQLWGGLLLYTSE
jgi:hypothetical protein